MDYGRNIIFAGAARTLLCKCDQSELVLPLALHRKGSFCQYCNIQPHVKDLPLSIFNQVEPEPKGKERGPIPEENKDGAKNGA